ncbi:MAG TPA: hypothetical protein VNT53_05980 [Pseudolysinimonas sp.]|nr:hypothetical protein [Pseudolysinimonas sp.]
MTKSSFNTGWTVRPKVSIFSELAGTSDATHASTSPSAPPTPRLAQPTAPAPQTGDPSTSTSSPIH